MIVNRFADITYRQTTALLAASFRRLGESVVVAEVASVTARTRDNTVEFSIRGIALPPEATISQQVADLFVAPANDAPEVFALSAEDVVLIRTNPGRDSARHSLHGTFLELMMIAEESGVNVVNRPANLLRFASKSSLLMLDRKYRPEMLVSSDADEVIDFVQAAPSDCIVKPLLGSRGENVLRVSKESPDLAMLITETFGNMQVVAQHFFDANHPGDRRVVVLDGQILESAGGIAGIERHPAAGDFRANLHAGGSAHPLSLPTGERESATAAAQLLADHGIRLAGVDMIGDKIIEFNVFSTGGLYDGNRFAGTDFSETIVRQLLHS